jgi:serine protease Do
MTNLNGTFTSELDALAQLALASLVVVQQQPGRGIRRFFAGAGAGIIWGADGLVLTNNHVLGRGSVTVALNDGRSFPAKTIARDPDIDLALLEIPASGLAPMSPAADKIRIGELVFAFGHPFGQRNTVTRGIISAFVKAHTRHGREIPILRTDVPLAPGNSGGPLVNARGELIGINAMIMGGDQSISIPVSVAREFAARVLEASQPPRDGRHQAPEGVI